MKKSVTLALRTLVSAAALAALQIPTASAQNVDFTGKQITMIIGNAAGGGTDAVGRLLGEYLVRYLPGKPTLLVRNMPGAGGITSLNWFTSQAKKDGTVVTMGASTQTDPMHWRAKASQYDPRTFRMVGGINRGATVLMLGKKAVERLTDQSKPPVVIGAIDGTRSGIIMSLWGGEYLGWNLKWVVGYGGTSELILALQRGEIDLSSTGNAFLINEMLQKGTHVALAQSGSYVEGKITPRPEYKDVPIFPNQIRPKLRNDVELKAFNYWEGLAATDKWLALPGGVSDDIFKTYEIAFSKATADADFLKRGRASISEDMSPISAVDQSRLTNQIAETTDEALAWIDTMKKKQGLRVLEKRATKVALRTVSTTIDEAKNGGRELTFKNGGKAEMVRVSSAETDIKLGGQTAGRDALKPGMACDITYGASGENAKAVVCK
ncbi:MAG: hypothetical protein RL477_1957 [Pseudomonadota bacterium]|jgi:tripartite-type tricarboxylate transporter receptor subunit TctC